MWEHVEGDLEIYITQDGHGVSLRKVLEAEIRNYARAARAALPRRTPAPPEPPASPSPPSCAAGAALQNGQPVLLMGHTKAHVGGLDVQCALATPSGMLRLICRDYIKRASLNPSGLIMTGVPACNSEQPNPAQEASDTHKCRQDPRFRRRRG